MAGSIELTAVERKMLLQAYCSGDDSSTSRRAAIVLLRADGLAWEQIRRCLYCSQGLIAGTLLHRVGAGSFTICEQGPSFVTGR